MPSSPMMNQPRVYAENDPDLPGEFRDLLVRMLSRHVENSTNPHYQKLLTALWDRCMTLAANETNKKALTKLMEQEVEHGVITARILKGLGVESVDRPIDQYAFRLSA